jgi:HNH endonuclease
VPDIRCCKVCDASFSYRETGRIRYCSDECFRKRDEQTPSVEIRQCRSCGTTFEANRNQVRKTYCSAECYAESKSRRLALTLRTCKCCDQPFTRAERGPQSQFCSDACKKASRRAGKLAAARKWYATAEWATCDTCGLRMLRRPNSEVTICSPCRQGKQIKHGVTRTYDRGCRCRACTDAVSSASLRNKYKRAAEGIPLDISHRARARRYGVQHQHVNKLQVYERDEWRCGLCGDPVDREAKWPSAMSASLDHIVPMSAGGSHMYENVQCAHLRCNLIKNDGRRAASLFPAPTSTETAG